jgi:hypothetical protein
MSNSFRKKAASIGGFSTSVKALNVFIVVVLICFGIPFLVRLVRKMMAKDAESQNDAHIKDAELNNSNQDWCLNEAAKYSYQAEFHLGLAQQLARHLGTCYKWYDPRSWTENDYKVKETISKNLTPHIPPIETPKGVGRMEFDVIGDIYFNIVSPGRSLGKDCASLLSAKHQAFIIDNYGYNSY